MEDLRKAFTANLDSADITPPPSTSSRLSQPEESQLDTVKGTAVAVPATMAQPESRQQRRARERAEQKKENIRQAQPASERQKQQKLLQQTLSEMDGDLRHAMVNKKANDQLTRYLNCLKFVNKMALAVHNEWIWENDKASSILVPSGDDASSLETDTMAVVTRYARDGTQETRLVPKQKPDCPDSSIVVTDTVVKYLNALDLIKKRPFTKKNLQASMVYTKDDKFMLLLADTDVPMELDAAKPNRWRHHLVHRKAFQYLCLHGPTSMTLEALHDDVNKSLEEMGMANEGPISLGRIRAIVKYLTRVPSPALGYLALKEVSSRRAGVWTVMKHQEIRIVCFRHKAGADHDSAV